jgi:hypothetical protein
MRNAGKPSAALLTREPGSTGSARHAVPDGRLDDDDQVLATFEAKYARVGTGGPWPPREHVFQALATAAAHGSPLAVLVYPDRFDAIWWQAHGFHDSPSHLAAIGLGLFSYRRGPGDDERGQRILDLLDRTPQEAPQLELVA